MNTINQSFVEKYRPKTIQQLVLPAQNSLAPALSFVNSPFPSAWLLYGKSGLGKTSLAAIMAAAAAGHDLNIQEFVGPDLDSTTARHLANQTRHRPLFGAMHVVVINEADAIPQGGQVRLLGILDRLEHCSWIFTSNEQLDGFESRFLSRLKTQLFSSQGIYGPATDWLLSIAREEGVPLERNTAQRLVKDSKNNLRASLQAFEMMATDYRRTECEPLLNHSKSDTEYIIPGLPFVPALEMVAPRRTAVN